MKTKRNCRGVFLLLYLAFFIAQSCQQDDETIIEGTLLSVEQVESTTQIVSGDEIPNVINFVKQQTNDKLQVSLKTTFSDSRQADLVIGNLSIDVVKQITNAYGRSNYSFVMIKTVDSPELSYINYIVKDTRYGMYGYFIEYVPLDQNSEGNLLNDQGEFHGTIRIYNQYGIYVGSNTFNNGVRATSDYENDCDNSNNGGGGQDGGEDPGDGPGDGTGSDGGDGPGPGDGPGDGDSGDGGTGGENIEIIITCGCDPEHEGGVDGNDDCHCTIPDEIVIDIRTPDDYYNKTGKRDPLRYPCSPDNENIQDQPCRCPSDVDDGQTDVDPQDENNDIPILLDLFEIAQLNEYIEPNLTANDLIIISELGIHSELLGYLVNNVNPDGPITFEDALLIVQILEFVNLTDEQIQFLQDNIEIAETILNRLEISNGLEEQDYIREVIDAGLNETLVTTFPLLKFPIGSNYEIEYPRLTQILQQKIPEMANNEIIVNAINGITEAPIDIIIDALQWGKGATVIVEQLGGSGDAEKYGAYRGHLDADLQDNLYIDIDLVNILEQSDDDTCFSIAIELLVAVTILHEYTHLGDFQFSEGYWNDLFLEEGGLDNEAGIVFEIDAFGEALFLDNVELYAQNNGLCD